MEENTNKPEAGDALARHSRKCSICHHPDREDIEQDFLHWSTPFYIQQEYDIDDARSLYCHARATGLIQRRRENLLAALDNIVERSSDVAPSADAILRTIRAYSCLDSRGRWTDPPSQIIYSASRSGPSEPAGPALDAMKTIAIPTGHSEQNAAPLLGPAPAEASDAPPLEDIPVPGANPNSDDQFLIPLSRLENPVSD